MVTDSARRSHYSAVSVSNVTNATTNLGRVTTMHVQTAPFQASSGAFTNSDVSDLKWCRGEPVSTP